tara:strand:+ start:75 stop:254 length:180 start_codon:yes stop_codon:yes gene_type:complete
MEDGQAEIKIRLKKGKITVLHPEGNFKLAEWIASKGDWNKLWDVIDKMVKDNRGIRAGK